jgi:chorismate dehydratase
MRPRVGHIQFLNCLPLYHMLVRQGVVLNIDLYKDTPLELCRRLLEGKLDISPVPAIEYARHADELLLLPRLTVSSSGRVMSILLVSKVSAARLDGRAVALTNTSATSQVLARIILGQRYRVAPHYFECPPDLPEMLREADAALLIGDDALRAFARPGRLRLYDLGAEWKALTGENMVYAVWAVRQDYAHKHPRLVKEVFDAFVSSIEMSLEQIDTVVTDIARWEPFPRKFLKDYFRTLKFEFGEEYQRGLVRYYEMARDIGAIGKVPRLKFVRMG